MNRIVIATLLAAFGLGLQSAMAQDVRSSNTEAKIIYKEAQQHCGLLSGGERDQCLADARASYISSKTRCESMMDSAKQECLRQADAAESRVLLSGVDSAIAPTAVDID